MEFIFVAIVWILITILCKTMFTKWKENKWINIIPESALQIFFGIFLAIIFYWIKLDVKYFSFDAHVFFAFLLPPIIFDAGYFMPNREFFGNFDGIMTFAVVGTVFNTFAIGFCLAILNFFGWFSVEVSTSEVLLFASLISAVDPVAVIAVFEEMHVNKSLFVTVFGEALFNDAISVVLFGIFKSFTSSDESSSSSEYTDYFWGVVAFFIVSFGGVLIGIVSAFGCALATKFTQNVPVMGPLLVFVIAYFGYVISEIFSFSSIIAAAVCGMMVKQYLEKNLSPPNFESCAIFTRNFAITTESMTFILLGLATISTSHHWDTLFVISTIAFCLFFRFIAIFGLAVFLKITRNKKIGMNELFLMSCGGLRGAIAFGVVLSIQDEVTGKKMFVTTTLAVIFFSVVIQGILIRPLIRILKVKTLEEVPDETCHMGDAIPHLMQIVEVTSGHVGINRIIAVWNRFNQKYLMPILTKSL